MNDQHIEGDRMVGRLEFLIAAPQQSEEVYAADQAARSLEAPSFQTPVRRKGAGPSRRTVMARSA